MSRSISILFTAFLIALSPGCNYFSSKSSNAAPTILLAPEGDDPINKRPQIVLAEKTEYSDGIKTIYVGNANGLYTLVCNQNQKSCVTPNPGTTYFLFNKESRWKFFGATSVVDLSFFQNWAGEYNNQENVALVPVNRISNKEWSTSGEYGIYWVKQWEKR